MLNEMEALKTATQADAAIAKAAAKASADANKEWSAKFDMLSSAIATLPVASPTIVPSILDIDQFRQYFHAHQSVWHNDIQPWWSNILNFPARSKTYARFCSAQLPSLEAGREEEALQNYLMDQLKTLFKKKSIQPQCSFIHTHNKPFVGSTRKPDVTLVPKDEKTASLHNLAAIISLKKTIDEDATMELASILLNLLISTPRRPKSE